MNRQILLSFGETLYQTLGPLCIGDIRILIDTIRDRGPDLNGAIHVLCNVPDGQATLVGLARWAYYAYPEIQLSHTYAAALLATDASQAVLDLVEAPWPAFIIEVPRGLLTLDMTGKEEPIRGYRPEAGPSIITRILVMRIDHKRGRTWTYVAFTEDYLTLFRFGVTTEELLPPTLSKDVKDSEHFNVFSWTLSSQDERTAALIGRLIVNTCLAMSDPTRVKKVGKGHGHYEHNRRAKEPTTRVFQVGQPVKHDFREAVAAYLHGDREKLQVQSLVSGHWKPKLGARLGYPVWIEPYWRGPEDAPILTRKHKL